MESIQEAQSVTISSQEKPVKKRNIVVRFFSFIWKAIKAFLISVGLFATLIPILLIVLIMQSSDTTGPKKDLKDLAFKNDKDVILTLDLLGPIRERPLSSSETLMARFAGENTGIYLPSMALSLREAAKNDHVKALFISLDQVYGSMANFSELRSMLEEFRAAKKSIFVWAPHLDSSSFYLASVANEIYLPQAGGLDIFGPVIQQTYFANMLEKIGVHPQVVRAGKYKSFAEPFVRNTPSEASIEMYSAIEESLRKHMAVKIAAGRGISDSNSVAVEGWFKKSLYTAEDAVKAGIVSSISFEDDALEKKEKELNVESVRFDSFARFVDKTLDIDDSDGAIAYIEAIGEIRMNAPSSERALITPKGLIKKIKWAAEDDDIKAVILRVSSPGGSALASDLIWNEIAQLAEKKTVVVSMGGVAASGGYYIASAAHKIIAQPTTITGSIGVISIMMDVEPMKEKYGINFHTITNSDRHNMIDMGKPASKEDELILSSGVDTIYQLFLQRVSAGRKMAVSDVDAIAQGRVWTGAQALPLGLVDGLGGLKLAVKEAKRLAKLNMNKDYPLKRWTPERVDILECLSGRADLSDCINAEEIEASMAMVKSSVLTKEQKLMRSVVGVAESFKDESVQTVWPGYYTTKL